MDNPEKPATQDTGRRQTKQKKTHHYTQANTNNVNKTWALLQTTGNNSHNESELSSINNTMSTPFY